MMVHRKPTPTLVTPVPLLQMPCRRTTIVRKEFIKVFKSVLLAPCQLTSTMVHDGITASLISNVSYVDGEPYVAPFTGTYDGDPVSLTFSVALGGGMPRVISSNIPGHPDAVFTIYKETSTSLIEAFEGTYSKPGEKIGRAHV